MESKKGTLVELKRIGESIQGEFSSSVSECVAAAIELDNDPPQVERDLQRIEQWLVRVDPLLQVHENKVLPGCNQFVLCKLSLKHRAQIEAALQRHESVEQYFIEELVTELPVLDNPDWDPSIRPRQRTLCIVRLALRRYRRPSVWRLSLFFLLIIVILWLLWIIYRIVLPQ
jgi:hypothetical protein